MCKFQCENFYYKEKKLQITLSKAVMEKVSAELKKKTQEEPTWHSGPIWIFLLSAQ